MLPESKRNMFCIVSGYPAALFGETPSSETFVLNSGGFEETSFVINSHQQFKCTNYRFVRFFHCFSGYYIEIDFSL